MSPSWCWTLGISGVVALLLVVVEQVQAHLEHRRAMRRIQGHIDRLRRRGEK